MASANFQGPREWDEWTCWLMAGLHGRNQWRLPVLLMGILFAQGRRTVSTWLRAAGVSPDYEDYYYFLASVGRNAQLVSWRLLSLVLKIVPLPERVLLVLDDTPTKRYGPHVEGADVHHNPTPGPADQEFLYGHIWVTLSLAVRHPRWGALALPLRAMLYVRQRTLASIPPWRNWTFRSKLHLAAKLVEWAAWVLKAAGKTVWVAADGAYAKRGFLRAAAAKGVPRTRRLVVHALPNAAIPLLTVLGLRLGDLVAGSIITETVFAWPGVGRLLVSAVTARDLAVARQRKQQL